jgi:hypothetical protein
MRCSGAGRGVTDLPTSVRGPGLAAAAGRPVYLVETGVFNTTTTAFAVSVVRFSAAGTPSGSVTEVSEDSEYTPAATVTTGNSGTPTVGGPFNQASIGAAIGAGVIWTYGGKGLRAPAGTTNGFILNLPTGTGQFFDFYYVWEE